jgi:hypothetical protein
MADAAIQTVDDLARGSAAGDLRMARQAGDAEETLRERSCLLA